MANDPFSRIGPTGLPMIADPRELIRQKDTGDFDTSMWGSNPPTARDIDNFKNFVRREGRLPQSSEDFKSIGTFWDIRRNRDAGWESNLRAFGNHLLEDDPEFQHLNVTDNDNPDFYWDEARLHQQGSKENDLFSFYQNMGDAQNRIGQQELARSERDMQVEMSQQRQQLLDEIRTRRQNQLRSGLSSAQIANEEIQMLLMGQQAQQQIGQGFHGARTQMAQQHQLNPFTAELQSRQHIQGTHQGTSAHYAASTADMIAQGRRYQAQAPQTQNMIDWVVDRDGK